MSAQPPLRPLHANHAQAATLLLKLPTMVKAVNPKHQHVYINFVEENTGKQQAITVRL
jgi:hypothetical protein